MKYSQSFIEEIRNRVRVSELVGKYISIRRAGREFHALCPFHKEKSPSFTINDEKGFFHCFGCGAHGDVIGFTMDYEHLGYREAIEKLAGLAGLELPKPTAGEVERESKEAALQRVMELVAAWLQEQLEQTSEGELARNYLRERGLSAETVARFRIGYAPADRDALKNAMRDKGITEQQLVECGMLIKVDDRAPYSRFRRRLMFPIRDRKSRVIAFGGRVLPGEPHSDAPKYLNSPETPLFHKGRQLFNLDLARRAAFDSKRLIICEGYMDVIALAQAGVAESVAPLGTAITEEQITMCWQLVDEPTLCLDGDNAGQRAMLRAADLALPLLVPGKTVRFALLPTGEDPDTLIKNIGKHAFDDVIANAQPLALTLWNQAFGVQAATPEARAAQEQALNAKIAQIKNASVQHYYKQFVRDKLRQMQLPMPQRFEKGKKFHAANNNVQPPSLPPPIRSADANLLSPASNLIALVVVLPSLLADAASEETWLHAPMPAAWQQQMHQLITELHIHSPDLSSEQLWQALQEEITPEAKTGIARALESLGIALADDETTRSLRAQRMWGEVVNDVDRVRLRADCAEAEKTMALDEEHFQRYMALKQQLEALDRERSRYYREDPLPLAGNS